jgi:type I restriction enzyme R subunit
MAGESEWKTRKRRIDPKLDAAGWRLRGREAHRTEEEDTEAGPADYALWLDQHVVGVVEAKKVTVGPQNVLTQAARYSKGLDPSIGTGGFEGHRCPFLYSTNGEIIWFHDVRHPLNRSRRIADFHTTGALRELLTRDLDADCAKLSALPHDHLRLRPYQKEANAAVERAISERKRNLLVAMATGTGKTFTLVNQIYRLMKSGVARRVLFLVDRRALAAQAVRAFSAFEVEPGKKFDHVYEVYSSRFLTEDFGEEEKFDPKVLPEKYLTDPQPRHAFVYVCTIQRMAIHILGRQAVPGLPGGTDESVEDDAGRLPIPIHAFDVIVADECHRGYTSQEISTWRSTLDHFDAIKIGLTATPASHTTGHLRWREAGEPTRVGRCGYSRRRSRKARLALRLEALARVAACQQRRPSRRRGPPSRAQARVDHSPLRPRQRRGSRGSPRQGRARTPCPPRRPPYWGALWGAQGQKGSCERRELNPHGSYPART